MAFLKTNDVELFYRLAGPENGPKLVLVNSLGTDCRIWDDVIAQLSGHYRILSYDLRGHGLSTIAQGPYSLEMHLADLTALVDAAGFDRFSICGVSIGGLISQGFAVAKPERLEAIVLCNTAAQIGSREFWDARMALVESEGIAAIADAIMQRWFSPKFQAEQAGAWAQWRELFLRNSPQGYSATCATLRDTDLSEAVRDIEKPVLVVAGSDDQATPAALVEATAQRIAGAQYVVLDGVGHLPCIEQPVALSQYISSFLEGAKHG